jgi:ATP-dependent Lon protease
MDNPLDYPDSMDLLEESLTFTDAFSDEILDEDGCMTRPFMPLRGIVLYPNIVTPLFVGRDRSLAALQAATANGETLIVSAQKNGEEPFPDADGIYTIGTEVQIGRIIRLPDNSSSVLSQGARRVEIVEFTQWDPYIRVRVRPLQEPDGWNQNTEALMRAVLDLFENVVELNRKMPEDAYTFALNADDPGWLADFIASTLEAPLSVKQHLLSLLDPYERLREVSVLLGREVDLLETETRIHTEIQEGIDIAQREHFLREQMRAIQGELGESDIFTQELIELRERAAAIELPSAVAHRVEKEIARLSKMPPMSPEMGVIRTYVDWILDLPWTTQSDDNLDVAHAEQVLDEDHYGLEKVKERILEYIAVRQIAPDEMRTPILCFVGPPGTGKTSIARSIATALNREFVRLSLGGIRDEAEIRGHRRTYIGALPGRIIQSMRRAGTRNPLFILDEIDKLGQDFRGDPAAALLEVLDPEQNVAFQDHYLELDFDLSDVLFLTTANTLYPIPRPLLDRMEVIEFPGYLEEEKLEIAHRFIIPRQLREHGLENERVRFDEGALKLLIRQYTYEAGVRNLEREIANVCRKIARRVVEHKRVARHMTEKKIVEILGPPRFSAELLRAEDEVGLVNGLAWTAAGGEILTIEVNLMPGKGGFLLTGQLGDVMQESARAALTYTRSLCQKLDLDAELFEQTDIHLHVPEGSVPKDGPSAGIAMATALISAFTGRPVRHNVGMTGEITLRGRVLPIGGIREKALAARRMGIDTVIVPSRNENNLHDIPKRLRQDINFVLVERMDEVLDVALLPAPTRIPPSNGHSSASEDVES